MKFCFILFLQLAIGVTCFGHPPSDLQSRVDALAHGHAGGVALAWVDKDGTAFFSAGQYSADDPRPISPDTVFAIGSISKVFTSLLLAESERLGKVSRNDSAAKYLLPPSDPDQSKLAKLTLLALATHTAGLPRLPYNIGPNPDANPNPYASYDQAALIAALRLHGPTAPVGRSMAYSNFGVGVLGAALGAAWGTSYPEALQSYVLTPLGLKATQVAITGTTPSPLLAPAHLGERVVPNWTFQALAGLGAVESTTRDLALFLSEYLKMSPNPLRESIDATVQSQHTADDSAGHIALAWFLTDDPARPVIWHNGATAGTHSFIAFNRKAGEGLVILANSQLPSEVFGFGLLGVSPPHPESNKINNAADFVGHYPVVPGFAIDIENADGSLRARVTGQPPFELREISTDRFILIGVPAELTFNRDTAGKVIDFIFDQNGQQHRAPRQPLPPPPKSITLSTEILHQYVGTYVLSPAFNLTVTEVNGSLFVQGTGQPQLPVLASAKDEFFFTLIDAQISFQRDQSSQVASLVLHQNGQNVPGKKVVGS